MRARLGSRPSLGSVRARSGEQGSGALDEHGDGPRRAASTRRPRSRPGSESEISGSLKSGSRSEAASCRWPDPSELLRPREAEQGLSLSRQHERGDGRGGERTKPAEGFKDAATVGKPGILGGGEERRERQAPASPPLLGARLMAASTRTTGSTSFKASCRAGGTLGFAARSRSIVPSPGGQHPDLNILVVEHLERCRLDPAGPARARSPRAPSAEDGAGRGTDSGPKVATARAQARPGPR